MLHVLPISSSKETEIRNLNPYSILQTHYIRYRQIEAFEMFTTPVSLAIERTFFHGFCFYMAVHVDNNFSAFDSKCVSAGMLSSF
jgi:hypothetical protein